MKKLSKHPVSNITINCLDYHYISKGTGKTIFLLHGFPDTAATWDSIIERLSENFNCIAPFLRGYYPTEIPKNSDYSVQTIANDINEIASTLNIESYSVIGHDWGASIAYAMANMFPVRINKICTIAMPHPQYLKPSIKLLYKARHILYFMNKKKAVIRVQKNDYDYLKKLYKRWSPNWKTYYKTMESVVYGFKKTNRTKAALSYYWELTKTSKEQSKLYKEIPNLPILVLVGEADGTVVLSQFDKMSNDPKNKFVVIKHSSAGHFLHHEDELFCLKHILDFF